MKLQVHLDAGAELDAAAAWYEREREGLGEELVEEVGRAFAVILAAPNAWPARRFGTSARPAVTDGTAINRPLRTRPVAPSR